MTIKFGFNHMINPALTPDQLVDAAVALGAVAIELRNDVGDMSLKDAATAARVGARARDAGLEVVSVNALYPFNVWNDERARQTEALAALAAAAGATGLVMCPLNEGKMLEDTPEKAASLRAALTAIRPILAAHGLKGFVEPLGFPVSSLRSKAYALSAIDDIGGADIFSLVHDTFHHTGAGEAPVFAARTGLVHISGLEDPAIGFDDMLDGHRVLVGPKDRLGNVEQLRRLYADGYDGIVSFEPFAREVHDLADPIAAVRDSMAWLREAVAA
ncbi:2-keto-myo-inositol isomerase [Roseiarcus fermentans]|uniref:2-keto-myo-inositol isomerase n=1 Tax=Roseiarcus fermentans TaxID=1473586 RepID=A0A366ETM7_9HYPH|nr:TIM barrel protein [Roseiarcus fermentans]RBP05748.1 2-keto-myo-inositol isomerase [Roseiarcus fermentans]